MQLLLAKILDDFKQGTKSLLDRQPILHVSGASLPNTERYVLQINGV